MYEAIYKPFPRKGPPNYKTYEPFMHQIQLVLEQLIKSQLPEENKFPTIFSVFHGDARDTAAKS